MRNGKIVGFAMVAAAALLVMLPHDDAHAGWRETAMSS